MKREDQEQFNPSASTSAGRSRSFKADAGERRLPREVELLLGREQEIARIVYHLRACTAAEVLERVTVPLANCSVRSMLNRLVEKGVLKRTLGGRAFIYEPAVTIADSGTRALARFADDYFAGSLGHAAASITSLLGGMG
jgi:predicted transcriptional regulator